VALLAALAAAAACAPMSAGKTDGDSAATTLVTYARTGGFAGFDDHLVVRGDGRANVRRRGGEGEVKLDAKHLDRLKAALDGAGLASLRDEYRSDGADLFTYTFIARGRTIVCTDGAVPPALTRLLSALNEIVDNAAVPPR
jgi:hypothetical protein